MATSDYLKRCKELQQQNREAGKRTVYTSPTGSRLIDHAERLEQRIAELEADRVEVRRLVADYMHSEGCSCCRGHDHDQDAEKLALMLDVELYEDGSGANFAAYRTLDK